jgi:hypothetical protein
MITGTVHQIPGKTICWAGLCPWTQTLCFGTDDGYFGIEGPEDSNNMLLIPIGREAINGIAFSGSYVGFSSREHVSIAETNAAGDIGVMSEVHDGGAHGVLSRPGGRFLAPLGDEGLLVVTPEVDGMIESGVARPPHAPLNLYRVVRLGFASDELYACAARRDGVVVVKLLNDSISAPRIHHFADHDIVDIASIATPQYPRGVVALSRNRDISLFRDIVSGQKPEVLSFSELRGSAYCLLATQGHVFVLTDKELISFPHLATRFLQGEDLQTVTEVSFLDREAEDAFMVGENQIVLTLTDRAVSYNVRDLVEPANDTGDVNGQAAASATRQEQFAPLTSINGWSSMESSDFALLGH